MAGFYLHAAKDSMWCWVCCSQVEVKLEGDGPWTLPDGSQDMEIVLTPGHTEFHCCLVYKPKKVIQMKL